MRHFICAPTITTRSHGMLQPTTVAALVARPGRALRASPRLTGTSLGTVDLAPITAAADQHLPTAQSTEKQSSRLALRQARAHQQHLDAIRNAGDNAPAFVPCTVSGTAPN